MVELACDFGLVRSLDPIGQMAVGKAPQCKETSTCMRNVFWTSNLGLEAGELDIAAHRGLPA